MHLKSVFGMVVAVLMLSGCGLKGPLYMPKDEDGAKPQTAVNVTSPYHDPSWQGRTFADDDGSYVPLLTIGTSQGEK